MSAEMEPTLSGRPRRSLPLGVSRSGASPRTSGEVEPVALVSTEVEPTLEGRTRRNL